jgi:glycosyltransferase involved in cell wall biosynthesis
MGGGAVLLLQFLQSLPAARPSWEWIVYLLPPKARQFEDIAIPTELRIEHVRSGDSSVGRLLWLHQELPSRLKAERVDALLSFANVALPRPPVPQVVYVHQLLAFPPQGAPTGGFLATAQMNLLRRLIVRGALASKSVIVQTLGMRSRLEESVPCLCGRVAVVPGCVSDISPGASIRPEKRDMIDRLTGPRLLYVAHPAEHKNHRTLVRAMQIVLRDFPSATLMLTLDLSTSENGVRDRKYVADLQRLSGELELGHRIAWLGRLNHAEVRYTLNRCTVAVFPSLEESFGLPIAEALVEGCALAASDLAYARDVAGPAAIYFDPLDPESIASSLLRLLTQPELINRLKQEAFLRAPRFEPTQVAEQIAALLEAAATQSKSAHAT